MPAKNDLKLDQLADELSDIAAAPPSKPVAAREPASTVAPPGSLVRPQPVDPKPAAPSASTPAPQPRVADPSSSRTTGVRETREKAKMQGMYLYTSDLRRLRELEFQLRRMELPVRGRQGPSLAVRAGVVLLSELMEKEPARAAALLQRLAETKS